MKKLSKINENVFDDMLSRNKGTAERKEDEITLDNLNEFGQKELYKYIIRNYVTLCDCEITLDDYDMESGAASICIPITANQDMMCTESDPDDPDKIEYITLPAFLENIISKHYNVESDDLDTIWISPHSNFAYFDNTEVIEIMDNIIKSIKNPGIRKK